jgi:hypothetical protein
VLGVPVLIGPFGLAVALGVLGRAWSGPAELLTHLDSWEQRRQLASRRSSFEPRAEPVVTASPAWLLWWRTAHAAGARPSLRRIRLIGVIAVPLSAAVAFGALATRAISRQFR